MQLKNFCIIYLITINILGACAVFWDKWMAQHGKWRIRERTLFLYCWLGGCPLVYVAMKACRHKTLHRSFMWGIPAIFILQLAIIISIVYFKYFNGSWLA